MIWAYIQDEHQDDKSRNYTVQENTLKVQRPTSKNTASTSANTSAKHSVNDTLEDTDGRGHRGEKSPSHHQMMYHDSEVANNEPATKKRV